MKNVKLDHEFFRRYCLHLCLNSVGLIQDYAMDWAESDTEMVDRMTVQYMKEIVPYRLMAEKEAELFPLTEGASRNSSYYLNRHVYNEVQEKLRGYLYMQQVQHMWDTEDDNSFKDEWFGDREEEFMKVLYSFPTDTVPDRLKTEVGFRGRLLTHNHPDRQQGLCLRDAEDLRDPMKTRLWYDELHAEDMTVPWDAHSIWDALLFLLSVQWMWKPQMYIMAPTDMNRRTILPRVTMYDCVAVATFCTVGEKFNEGLPDIRPLYKNAILLGQRDDTFEIVGGYSVYQGDAYNIRTEIGIEIEPPLVPPPFHSYTGEELSKMWVEERRREELRKHMDDEESSLPF